MKLSYMEQPIRAKKDTRPRLDIGRAWKEVHFILNGEEKTGLISTHWLYYEVDGQWYKLNCAKYGVSLKDLELATREIPKQTLEEKRARRQARRKAKRAEEKAKKAEPQPADYTEELSG